ncbi:MAG: succinyldiaminopimelate transaminase, partial [Gammaproteobacteria bacterium AqS3]|nr:succinyldiaminopimelate transaminase [Gammaproteobacteria bacterium AqS3]
YSVEVLPGSLMAMHGPAGGNPGAGFVRISLVDTPERCAEGARRIAQALAGRTG